MGLSAKEGHSELTLSTADKYMYVLYELNKIPITHIVNILQEINCFILYHCLL